MPEDRGHAENLLSVANDAAGVVGSRFVGFLAVGAYVAITVVSTTDAMLVHGTAVHLPVLNVDVPMMGLFGFYTIAPWLILLMHTDLLLQMSALSRKLGQFRRASNELPEGERLKLRERLVSFYYVQFLMGDDRSRTLYVLAGLVLWITVVVFPLALLLGIQIRFLSFHSTATTWWHRIAVIGDVLLILTVWPRLSPRTEGGERRDARLERVHAWGFLAPGGVGVAIVLVSLVVATIPADGGPGSFSGWWSKVRNLQLENEILTADRLSAKVVNTLRDGGADEKEKELALVSPLSFFQGRDLRYGNFVAAVIPKFDFRARRTDSQETVTTQLRGADFSWAQMQKVLLDDADAEETKFDGAELQEASLVNANLRRASLNGTQLQHARLTMARLDNAQAQNAKLQGADFSDAQLANADLTGAQLQGASFRGANLSGVTFDGANLEGADLSRALLSGAHFKGAQMQSAVLLEAVVDAALGEANLDLTDVQSVSHEGALPKDVFKNVTFAHCDDQQAKGLNCGASLRSDQYLRLLTQHLVELACADTYVARGLVDQVHYNLGVHTRDPRWPALAHVLSTCLSQPTCEGIGRLDHSTRAQLEQDAKEVEGKDIPLAVGAVRVADLGCAPRTRTAQ